MSRSVQRGALIKWCQQQTKRYANVQIRNFSDSWADGLAFCALLHSFNPRAIPQFQKLSSSQPSRNLKIAFNAAYKHYQIPKTLSSAIVRDPENEDQVMQYVSKLFQCLQTGPSSLPANMRDTEDKGVSSTPTSIGTTQPPSSRKRKKKKPRPASNTSNSTSDAAETETKNVVDSDVVGVETKKKRRSSRSQGASLRKKKRPGSRRSNNMPRSGSAEDNKSVSTPGSSRNSSRRSSATNTPITSARHKKKKVVPAARSEEKNLQSSSASRTRPLPKVKVGKSLQKTKKKIKKRSNGSTPGSTAAAEAKTNRVESSAKGKKKGKKSSATMKPKKKAKVVTKEPRRGSLTELQSAKFKWTGGDLEAKAIHAENDPLRRFERKKPAALAVPDFVKDATRQNRQFVSQRRQSQDNGSDNLPPSAPPSAPPSVPGTPSAGRAREWSVYSTTSDGFAPPSPPNWGGAFTDADLPSQGSKWARVTPDQPFALGTGYRSNMSTAPNTPPAPRRGGSGSGSMFYSDDSMIRPNTPSFYSSFAYPETPRSFSESIPPPPPEM